MERWGGLLEALEAAPGGEGAAAALAALQGEIPAFLEKFEDHLQVG